MSEVRMPQLGETVMEGTIIQWYKQVGDEVAEDEPLFEVSTDKVDSEVPSPMSGVLVEIVAAEGDTVEVGAVIAVLSEDGAAAQPASGPPRISGRSPAFRVRASGRSSSASPAATSSAPRAGTRSARSCSARGAE